MRRQWCEFAEIAASIEAAERLRDSARYAAFDQLEASASTLAAMATQVLGSRERAAHWMCVKQRRLDGRSIYEALAEGEVDRVWDLMAGSEACSPESLSVRMSRHV